MLFIYNTNEVDETFVSFARHELPKGALVDGCGLFEGELGSQ
jgi:hypothetical protein